MDTNLLEYKMDLIAEHLGVYRIEEVAAVMRRQHTNPDDGRIVDVVDFYPAWNAYGTYGKMKICHEYLDEEWQKARFQKYSGFSVEQLPVYDAQTALVRRFGQEHRCEIPVAPFRLMVQPRQDENGNSAKTLILKYLVSPKARQAAPAQTAAAQPAANGNGQAARPQQPVQRQAAAGKIHADQMLSDMGVDVNSGAATNGRSAVTAVSPTEWLERAIAATDPFDFDTCVSRAILFFDSADRVESARIGMFGEWKPGLTAAYLAGIKKYAHTRDELETNQSPVSIAHREAKSAALVEYRKVIDSRQPVGGAA